MTILFLLHPFKIVLLCSWWPVKKFGVLGQNWTKRHYLKLDGLESKLINLSGIIWNKLAVPSSKKRNHNFSNFEVTFYFIFSGWCAERRFVLNGPKGYRGDFSWERYLEETRSKAVSNWAFKTPKNEVTLFKKGKKILWKEWQWDIHTIMQIPN